MELIPCSSQVVYLKAAAACYSGPPSGFPQHLQHSQTAHSMSASASAMLPAAQQCSGRAAHSPSMSVRPLSALMSECSAKSESCAQTSGPSTSQKADIQLRSSCREHVKGQDRPERRSSGRSSSADHAAAALSAWPASSASGCQSPGLCRCGATYFAPPRSYSAPKACMRQRWLQQSPVHLQEQCMLSMQCP